MISLTSQIMSNFTHNVVQYIEQHNLKKSQ